MAIAKCDVINGKDGDWKFLGMLTFLDPPRPDTAKTIADAISYGKISFLIIIIIIMLIFLNKFDYFFKVFKLK